MSKKKPNIKYSNEQLAESAKAETTKVQRKNSSGRIGRNFRRKSN